MPRNQPSPIADNRLPAANLRRIPLQARGHATVEAILDATARLFESHSPEAINTNLIAAASGVNIATLYQYFANKHAVLIALFDRQAAERQAATAEIFAGIAGGRPWRSVLGDAIDMAFCLHRAQVGATAVRRAVRATPELRAHGDRVAERTANGLAVVIKAVARDLAAERALRLARVVVETVGVLLDTAPADDDAAIAAECKTMVMAYLAASLEPEFRRS